MKWQLLYFEHKVLVAELGTRLEELAEAHMLKRGLWICAQGPWGAVEERDVTFPERCSGKINLAFLGHLKLQWVISDCSGEPPKETIASRKNGHHYRFPSFP